MREALETLRRSILAHYASKMRGLLFIAAVSLLPAHGAQARQQGNAGTPDAPAPGETYAETIPGTDVVIEMAYIPGGTFILGSPEGEAGRRPDEGPQRTVRVAPFWMGVFEVTYDVFAVFRFRNRDSDTTAVPGSAFSADAVARPSPPYEDPAHGMGDQGYPAVSMTQWAALHFARWLSEKTGRFYRLPTEAEWEYACRAGTATAYSFGETTDALGDFAWYYGNSDEVFHPVGQKKPNPWGLYDLHGNVAEWTLDQYDAGFYGSLPEDTVAAPWAQPTSLHPRTVRGGAYDDDPDRLRCAARLASSLRWKRRDPQIPKSFWWNTDSEFVGFRLIRPAEPLAPEEQTAFWRFVLGE